MKTDSYKKDLQNLARAKLVILILFLSIPVKIVVLVLVFKYFGYAPFAVYTCSFVLSAWLLTLYWCTYYVKTFRCPRCKNRFLSPYGILHNKIRRKKSLRDRLAATYKTCSYCEFGINSTEEYS